MNKYLENLDRMEFVVTLACTGKCKHCSEGEHTMASAHLRPQETADALRAVASKYELKSIMTFGGEPLLFPETVYAIHTAAKEMNIPKRQIITNGYFSKNNEKTISVAEKLAESGVNDLLLSVDAFHQETIPLEPVTTFARAFSKTGARIRLQPAWLVSKEDKNQYNIRTKEILAQFDPLNLPVGSGNVIFPSGNALKYLGEYFDSSKEYINPYEEDPRALKSISVDADGTVFGKSIYTNSILDILKGYSPE